MKPENTIGRTEKTEPKKPSHWLIWMLVILAIGAAFLIARPFIADSGPPAPMANAGKPSRNITSVIAKAAVQGDLPVYLNGLGTVTGLRTVTVKSRVDGELVKVSFKEGGLVKAGEMIAEIDPRPYQVQLMQAEGQLMRDEALLKNAELDLQRYQTLLEQDSIAAQQAATQAAAVKQYQGIVATDKALVANAKLQLDYAKITAPISGRLGLRIVDQGNIVKASDTNGLVVITQTQPIAVVFTLPEDQVPAVMKQLHAGKTLTLEAFDRSGKNQLAQGTLLAVDNQIDLSTGTVKLKGQFANDDTALFANQFVNIKMQVDTLHDAVIIPGAAVQTGNAGTFVYVVKGDQTVSVRNVKLGAVYQDQVAVLEGVQANERVVVEGADKLRDDAKVKLIDPDTEAATPVQNTPKKPKDMP
ncbi:MAG: MdtA/MuxA family multidrug efflux RND transporter periplasmic adaptor subunit [Methylovulum miyakonense]|uniref:MdtA/MuxA family multidrug efflux RND transporter periplasmic adaptor subunit n=1 Tax=Methylovulum miyakonense TaxID=645578 RepID=UPI003BB51F38